MTTTVAIDEIEILKQAFLRGAGIAPDAPGLALTPETMELMGKLLAGSLQGTIDLLALRSLVKQEVKADVTMVVVRNNNPLKFFPDSQTVLTQMLRKKMPGFMEPLEAIDDARRDLHGHIKGVMSGARASLYAMMRRLSPAGLENQVPEATGVDKMMPARRKASLWQLYKQEFQVCAGDAKDPFKGILGPDFITAYEKEVDESHGGQHD